jgi:ubiquinone/menaquinone biosynthesis C-methylase UbiE
MKKYILLTLCTVAYNNGMEMTTTTAREPREWDAHAYAQGNILQETAALEFLKESTINLKNKTVLDVGCGTGNITAKIASVAQHVHGIDASKNMIEYAQKQNQNSHNLSFEHCFAEDFTTIAPYDAALAFFSLHWVENKEDAIEKINHALKINGDFFGAITTQYESEPLDITVGLEMVPGLQSVYSFLKGKDLIKEVSVPYLTKEQFKAMLIQKGFNVISYEYKDVVTILKNKEELANFKRPLLFSRPFVQSMPSLVSEYIFNKFIDLYLTKLSTNEDGHYILPAFSSTVFHAQKTSSITDCNKNESL